MRLSFVHLFICPLLVQWVGCYEILVDEFEPIPMGSVGDLKVRIKLSYTEEDTWDRANSIKLTFNLTNPHSWALTVLNESIIFNYDDMLWGRSKALTLEAAVIGVDMLNIYSETLSEEDHVVGPKELSSEIHVSAIISNRTLNNVFTIIMMIMIVVNTVNMGGQLDMKIIKEVFRRPVGPVVGFTSQFVLMPLFSFGIGALMFDDKLFRLGLFVLGCSPGGNGSNFWCLLLNGDINLSITMTFVSTVAALGMMPLWIFALGRFLSEGDLVIPYSQLFTTLLLLIGPIALGMWIRHRFTRGAKIMKKIIVPFTLLTVLFIFTAGIYINLFIFMLMTGKMIAAGFIIAFSGYLFGALFAWICRLKASQITAVSIETAFQNGGIAFVLLKLSLPQPYGDMAAVAPVAQLMLTGLPLWLVLALWKIYQRLCLKKQPNEEESNDETSKIDDVEVKDGNDFKDKGKSLSTNEKTELVKRLETSPEECV